ncbi:TPA: L-tyrosine/L-tryptophan isonitrile synthase family protein [Klebsiella variicola]|uniref:L-tyrosine/L-tryptophan isonitrile synthase family protein n=1 Tax=Klebsiella variicola TaxID=244366 RepID=UPI0012AB9DF5|nr:L-tyrosine/L-tryptophan isonitrile synthase family protein [Klebsiella variicola]HCT8865992.1 L-tyrosine/L-tryptophan isonitrile synthase family protein [Klebsiella variicola]HDT0378055.1 L-tyrosine/L-tryptophan isonitrile synthase family protein [Klebsiella variicola]
MEPVLNIFMTSHDEYHTDETASTFGILQTLPEHIPSKENHIVPGEIIEEWISNKYGALIKQLTDRISNNALRNLLRTGQDNPCDFREIITEVMTSRLIRRGTLSAEARAQRVADIQTDSAGRVTFSILLLPFRTPSPLKHDSLLPDLGEYYTLSVLYALAASCRQVQLSLFNMAHSVSETLKAQGTDPWTLLRQAGERTSGKRGEAMTLIEEDLRLKFFGKEYIRRRKFIRSILQNDTCLNYEYPEHLSSFLLLLSDAEMSPVQFRHWIQADITPVHIYAIQDEYRYPCFDMLDRKMIRDYRDDLLAFMDTVNMDNQLLSLIRYEDIQNNLSWKTRYFNDLEYTTKLNALMACVSDSEGLYQAEGRGAFLTTLREQDPRLQQLFEPLLFALPYPLLETYAREQSLEYGEFYCQFMNNIYTPQKEDVELLRRVILNQVLHAVARYVAAYESNTAGKNTTGFDDVRSLFPETLRMSIHRKDEKHGHYSVQISPSSSRVPWHGVAVLEPTQNGFLLDVRLEREVRAAGYTGVSPTGREQCPLFFVPPGISLEQLTQRLTDDSFALLSLSSSL